VIGLRRRHPGLARRARATVLAFGVCVAVAGATPLGSTADVSTVRFSTTPGLYPAFAPSISDYVVRCTPGTPVQVSIANTDSSDTTTMVSVGGQAPRTGAFSTSVGLGYSQGFTVAVAQGATSKSYHVRCLPAGFPTWTTQQIAAPQAQFYLVAPSLGSVPTSWAIVYDANGVPLWWMAPSGTSRPLDAKLVVNGGRPDVLWTDMQAGNVNAGPAAEEHSLDGTFAKTIHISSPYTLNPHEVQLLSNGNYLVIGGYNKAGVDLSPIGGSTSATILDDVIQEVTPSGTVVWTWDAYAHVGIDEVDTPWRTTATAGTGVHDVYHINSAVTDSSGNLLVSLRYTDAVFYVTDPAASSNAGKVIWKLGGTATQHDGGTLLAISDPSCSGSCFGGQHYARFFDAGDGNLYVTLHDNGTNRGRAPRAVRYRIDLTNDTATKVEQITDTAIQSASCCGSAQRLPGGDWVVSWGANPVVAEYSTAGRVFAITFNGAYSYRADAILPGVLTPDALRSAMDARYPVASDTQPPSAPSALTAIAAGSTHVNLAWTASTDNVGVAGYRLERCKGTYCTNFVQIATPSAATYADSGLAANARYRYRVRAFDAAGNTSAYSNVAAATTARVG